MSQLIPIPSSSLEPAASVPLLEARVEALEHALAAQIARFPGRRADKVSMVVCSGSLDAVLAALTVATGAASQGSEVHLFFTFWATAALRRPAAGGRRPLLDRLLGWMLPAGTRELRLSHLHLAGAGSALMRRRMAAKGIPDADDLLAMARELGIHLHACEMSLDLLGMRVDDLIDYPGLEVCGVAAFMEHAQTSATTLFI